MNDLTLLDLPNRLKLPTWKRAAALGGVLPALALLALFALLVLPGSRPWNDTSLAQEATAQETTEPETAPQAADLPAGSFAIVGARVFDGREVIPEATVVVEDGKITAVGAEVEIPADLPRLDGRGKTLLPGLLDSHVHAFSTALADALPFGVTTAIDLFTQPQYLTRVKRRQAEDGNPGEADLISAGNLVTAPGGHGTQYGFPIPTLDGPQGAQAFVDARIAEGSDLIKIVYDDGTAYDFEMPTLSLETLTAAAAAAHRRGKLAVVHVGSSKKAREVLETGVDGLAHLFTDAPPASDFVERAAATGVFVIPTLTVLENLVGRSGGRVLREDPRLAPYLTPEQRTNLGAKFRHSGVPGSDLANAFTAVRRLHAAAVPILAGSDAPNPGTAHGASLHRELELLVEAGLTPADALTAATAAPAAAFGFEDRGRIAPGLRADLLLVEGDPTRDILATRAIVGVWKLGVPAVRQRREVAQRAAAAPVSPGPVSDFDASLASRFGVGWGISTDANYGGDSSAEIRRADGGAGGSEGALLVEGVIGSKHAYPWAGAVFYAGADRMAPVDLSAAKEVVFFARGESDPTPFRVMLLCESLGAFPAQIQLSTGTEWKKFVIPLSQLRSDGSDLQALLFTGSLEPGSFRLWIDEVEVR